MDCIEIRWKVFQLTSTKIRLIRCENVFIFIRLFIIYFCVFITHQVCRPFLKTIKQLMLPIKSELEFCVLQLPVRERADVFDDCSVPFFTSVSIAHRIFTIVKTYICAYMYVYLDIELSFSNKLVRIRSIVNIVGNTDR